MFCNQVRKKVNQLAVFPHVTDFHRLVLRPVIEDFDMTPCSHATLDDPIQFAYLVSLEYIVVENSLVYNEWTCPMRFVLITFLFVEPGLMKPYPSRDLKVIIRVRLTIEFVKVIDCVLTTHSLMFMGFSKFLVPP